MGRTKQRKKHAAPALRADLQRRDLDAGMLYGYLDRARNEPLSEEAYQDLRQAVGTLAFLQQEVERKGASLDSLRYLLFGPKTESTSAVLGGKEAAVAPKAKKKVPGHGRNGAKAFPGAKRMQVVLEGYKSGDPCPVQGCNGKVYPQADPATLIRMRGVAPFLATIYELERWRCNLCETVFTAKAPEGVGEAKYDATVPALIGEFRYGAGLPHHRIERLQACFGIPLPVSTQWELVLEAAGLLQPAFSELVRQAAQGQLLHNDDTPMQILNKVSLPEKKDRKAIQTTGILSHVGEHRIALFLTGVNHAGENLEAVLVHRAADLTRPIQMSDALAANLVGEAGALNTIVAHCLVHARRRFVEVEGKFPQQVRILLRFLRLVYKLDARTRQREMDPEARLAYHQRRSSPLMEKLKGWLADLKEGRQVEPNSGLGDAVDYMWKHWEELTLFLRVAGAPLDNSAAERLLKRAILHRKNSLFYKTRQGAEVGDTFMSLIHTAELNGVQSFDYLVALLRNPAAVKADPGAWLPWNYPQALAATATA